MAGADPLVIKDVEEPDGTVRERVSPAAVLKSLDCLRDELFERRSSLVLAELRRNLIENMMESARRVACLPDEYQGIAVLDPVHDDVDWWETVYTAEVMKKALLFEADDPTTVRVAVEHESTNAGERPATVRVWVRPPSA